MRRRSRGMTTGVLAVWALLCAPAIGLDAQQAATPAQTAPAQAAPAPSAQEKQAPPTVDSDPVTSPDPDTRTPVPAPSSAPVPELQPAAHSHQRRTRTTASTRSAHLRSSTYCVGA